MIRTVTRQPRNQVISMTSALLQQDFGIQHQPSQEIDANNKGSERGDRRY